MTASADPLVASVVIPVLNGADTIAEQLDALMAEPEPGSFEVIVVDNGSTDGTGDIVRGYAGRSPDVRLIEAPRRGINVARNAGLAAARTEKVLFCDADDIVGPGWVAAMARALDEADGVGGTFVFDQINAHMRHAAPSPAIGMEGRVPWPVGACSGWRRSLLLRIGGFDESWSSGGDDIDLALRAARAGATVVHAPDAIVHKRERASRKALARQSFKYGQTRPRIVKLHPDLAERRGTIMPLRNLVQLLARMARGDRSHPTIRATAHALGRIVGSVKHGRWAP